MRMALRAARSGLPISAREISAPIRTPIGLAVLMLASSTIPSEALAQACPTPATADNTQCTVAPGTTINVTAANGAGLSDTGSAGLITANSVTVNLNSTGARGGWAQQGASILFNGSTLNATLGALGNAAGRIGLLASGNGSSISADGATITMGLVSTAVTNLVGVQAEGGGIVSLSGTVAMNSNANGTGIVGVRATGTGTRVSMTAGATTATSRGALGAFAESGGTIELGDGVTVSASGAQTTGTDPRGSHALLSSGAGALVAATGINAITSGTLASAARAEQGGTVRLTDSTLSATGAGSAAVFAAGASVVSGGQMILQGSRLSADQQYGYGLNVQGAGSSATVTNTQITTSGNRSVAVNVLAGGAASLAGSTA